MRGWIVGLLVLLVVFLVGFGWLYWFAGLRQYWRATGLIRTTVIEEDRTKESEEFYGTDPRGAERGIMAGSLLGRVWVWRDGWLESYPVDQYSIFSSFDGCSENVRARIKEGVPNVIQQILFTDIEKWWEGVRVGDYVVVYPTLPGQGGKVGNLREIYTYNFWLFLQAGIDTQCAK